MQFARMESKGPQFPMIVMVHGVLGHRAMRKGMLASVLDSHMEKLCREQGVISPPAPSTTRRWAAVAPGLPERALEHPDQVRLDQIQPWAMEFLVDTAGMRQEPATAFSVRGDRSEDGASIIAKTITVVAVVYAGAKISSWLFGPHQTENGPGKNRRPRRRFRFAR